MQLDRGSDKHIGRTVLHGTTRLIGGRILRTLITLGGLAVLARLLTPADFGVVAVAAMILPLATALLDGLIDVPTIREDGLDRGGLSNLVWVGLALMVGLIGLIWIAASSLSLLLNSPRLDEVLRVLCFGLMLQPFIAAGNALLRREHRFGAAAVFLIASGATYVISAIILAFMGFGIWSLVFGQLLSLLAMTVGLVVTTGIPIRPPSRFQADQAWQLGGMGLITRLLAWTWSNIDTLFASASLGAAAAGTYSRAYNITTQMKEPFAALDQTVRQAFLAHRSLDDASAARATRGGLRLVVLAASMLAGGVIVMREAIVMLLLGPQWDAVVVPLAVLSASLPARVARLYLDGFTYTRGSMRHMLWRNIAIVALLAAGLWVFSTQGVTAIAVVVAGVHVITLFFRGGPVDVAVAGTTAKRLAAMVPGYAIGAALVLLCELAAWTWLVRGEPLEWAIRATIFILASILVIAALPGGWLPKSLSDVRRRLNPVR